MDLKIINKKNNVLLSRIEVTAEAQFSNEATPKKEGVKKRIAELEKVSENLVIVKKIKGNYGLGKASILAYVYKNESEMKNIEPKPKVKKAAQAGAAVAKEAPQEAKKEEKGKE